jgi:hypothetical protein
MTIQIEQKFPRCQRCGRMIHFEAARIEATSSQGRTVVFCSEECQGEYAELFGLAAPGTWASRATRRPRGGARA